MHDITYRRWRSEDEATLLTLIPGLYQDGSEENPMTEERIRRTFRQLTAHPDYGTIIVFEHQTTIIGYAILINFWSNEYGGILLSIDELYVSPPFRSQGIGTHFIRHLQQNKERDWVALELEVLPYNKRALRLYQRLGFLESDRTHMLLDLTQ